METCLFCGNKSPEVEHYPSIPASFDGPAEGGYTEVSCKLCLGESSISDDGLTVFYRPTIRSRADFKVFRQNRLAVRCHRQHIYTELFGVTPDVEPRRLPHSLVYCGFCERAYQPASAIVCRCGAVAREEEAHTISWYRHEPNGTIKDEWGVVGRITHADFRRANAAAEKTRGVVEYERLLDFNVRAAAIIDDGRSTKSWALSCLDTERKALRLPEIDIIELFRNRGRRQP